MWKVSLKTWPNLTYLLMTCKLFILWTLNRQAKIFLRTAYWIMKISWKHHTGGWGKNISRKTLQGQNEKELFRKTKKKNYRNIKSPNLLIASLFLRVLHSCLCFSGFFSSKTKISNCIVFFVAPTIVETAMAAFPY